MSVPDFGPNSCVDVEIFHLIHEHFDQLMALDSNVVDHQVIRIRPYLQALMPCGT